MSLKLHAEKDMERLRQAALLLEAENKRLVARVVELTRKLLAARGEEASVLQLKLQELERQLAQRNAELFGRSSEKRPREDKTDAGQSQTAARPREGHGPREQPALPLIEVEHSLDEADEQCPKCGGELKEMEGCFEESEEVDVVERRFVLKKHKRKKYRCGCGACVETALGPTRLQPGGRYSVDFAVEVAVQKYADHLPLERQVRIMQREGLVVDSQTLWDQLEVLARQLAPVLSELYRAQMLQGVLGVDETRWPLLGSEKQTRWHAWALSSDKAVVYRIAEGRGAEQAREVLGDYRGIAMTDGYPVYEVLAKEREGFVLAHCWSHVRRKFLECEEKFPQEAVRALELIGELYAVEREAGAGPPEERLRLRQEKSRSIIKRLHEWALSVRTLPESGLGKALRYMSNLWPGLTRFLEDGRIPLDNNATERAMRGPVVGRKNHYGSRSRRGTEVAALFYSLLETAKLCGVEPKRYLREAVLGALRGEPPLLPHQLAQPLS